MTHKDSKKHITDALLTLMGEKSFEDISISEICDEALLARRTFYRHFGSKMDVIEMLVSDAIEAYIQYLKLFDDLSYANIVNLFFDFWLSKKPELLMFKKSKMLYLLAEKVNVKSMYVYEQVRGQIKNNKTYEAQKIAMAYSFGGLWNLLLLYLEDSLNLKQLQQVPDLSLKYFNTVNKCNKACADE